MKQYRLESGKLVKVRPEHEQQFLQKYPTATLVSGNQQSSAQDATAEQGTAASNQETGQSQNNTDSNLGSGSLESLGKNVTNSYNELDSINTTLKNLKSSMGDAKAFNNEVLYNSLAEEYNSKIEKYKNLNAKYTEAVKLYKAEDNKQVATGVKVKTKQEDREESSFISDIFGYIPSVLLPAPVRAAKAFVGESWLGETVKRGWSQAADTGEAADIILGGKDVDLQTVSEWVEANKDKAENYEESERMLRFMKKYEAEGRTWTSFFKNVKEEPSLMAELLIQSYATMAGTAWDSPEALAMAGAGASVGAGVGAAATWYGFGAGAIPGGIAGAMGGLATSMEASLTLGELVREELENEGKEFTDENVLALMQSDKGKSIRNKAVGRGVAIGVVEGITGGAAGRATSTVLKTGAKIAAKSTVKGAAVKVGSMAVGTGVEAVGGGLGEVAGRLVAGQEMDKAEIGFEAITGTATAPLNVGYALGAYKKPSYKLNGEIISYDKMKDFIDTATNEDIAKADISIENDLSGLDKDAYEKQNKHYLRSQIDPRVSNEKDIDSLVDLETKLQKLNQETQSGKNRAKAIKEQIKEITDKYSDVDITTDEVMQKRTKRSEVQKARRENRLNATIKFAEEQGKLIGKETIVAENDTGAQAIHDKAVEEYNAQNPDNKIKGSDVAGADGFIVGDVIVINKDIAGKTGAINVGAHELLHGVMAKHMKQLSPEAKTKLITDFKNTITKEQFNYIEKRLKSEYKEFIDADPDWINHTDEWITIFSDGIKQGNITFNEGIFMKLAQFVQNIARKFGYNKEFKNGRQVYNFLKNYQKDIDKGELSKRSIDFANGGTSVTETAKSISDAKGPIDKLGKIDSDGNDMTEPGVGNFLYQAEADEVVRKIKEEGYLDGLIAAKYKVKPVPDGFVGDVLAELTPHIKAFKPESNDSLFGYIQSQIRNKAGTVYKNIYMNKGPARTVDVDATTSEGAPLVQIEADTDLEMQRIDEIGLDETEVQERSRLRRDIRLDKGMMQTVRNAVIKTFGTKLPEVSSKKFRKALEIAFRTELKKPIQDMMGGRSEYNLFLRNHSKAIFKALPVETLVQMERNLKPEQRIFTESRRITKPTEVDKLISEGKLPKDTSRTAGPQLHTKKPFPGIDKILAYFRGANMDELLGYKVGASTLGTRKDKLAMSLGEELAFDATSEVLQDPTVQEKRKGILEIQGLEQLENESAIIAKQINRDPNIKFSKSGSKLTLGISGKNKAAFMNNFDQVLDNMPSIVDKKAVYTVLRETYSDEFTNAELKKAAENISKYADKVSTIRGKLENVDDLYINSDDFLKVFILQNVEKDVIEKSLIQLLSNLLPAGFKNATVLGNDLGRIVRNRERFISFVRHAREELNWSDKKILRLVYTQYKGMMSGASKIADGRFIKDQDGDIILDPKWEDSKVGAFDGNKWKRYTEKDKENGKIPRGQRVGDVKRTKAGSPITQDFRGQIFTSTQDLIDELSKIKGFEDIKGKSWNQIAKERDFNTKTFAETSAAGIAHQDLTSSEYTEIGGRKGPRPWWAETKEEYEADLAVWERKKNTKKRAKEKRAYEERLAQAKEAREAVTELMTYYINSAKKGIIDYGDVVMLGKMLGSGMTSPMKRAANLAYIGVGVEDIPTKQLGSKTEYEHIVPTNVKMLEMVNALINDGELSDDFWNDYEVAIIPKIMDKGLIKNGLRDFKSPTQKSTDENWRRYYNKLMLGEPGIVALRSIKPGDKGKMIGEDFVKASNLLTAKEVGQKAQQLIGSVSIKYSKSKGMSTFDFDETLIIDGENFVVATKGDKKQKIKDEADRLSELTYEDRNEVYNDDSWMGSGFTVAEDGELEGMTWWEVEYKKKKDLREEEGRKFLEAYENGDAKKKRELEMQAGVEIVEISSDQWPIQGPALAQQGFEFDFSDFANVRGGKEGPLLQKMKNQIEKYGNKNVFVLTARQQASAGPIHQWLKSKGISIPLRNITGLGKSEGSAKGEWMLQKFAEGYNDMYFVDDALPNVEAVKKVLDQLDIKSKVVQAKVKFSKSASQDFNKMLERSKGVAASQEFSSVEAALRGAKKGRFKFFVPPSAEDFKGLIYAFLGTGKQGDQDLVWFKDNLFDPFAKGIRELNSLRQRMTEEYSALKKQFPNVVKSLNDKVGGTDFTVDNAVRVYLWNMAGFKVPGISESQKKLLVDHVAKNAELVAFADVLSNITRRPDGYVKPKDFWIAQNIGSDLHGIAEGTNREEFLTEWKENKDLVFSKENLNKIEAIYGTNFREALEDILYRMETGSNRPTGRTSTENKFINWINGSVGAVMFLNMRSAALQGLSMVNFLNFEDNNIFAAAKAFANQKQFWSDFIYLINSDMLKQRRAGLKIDVSASELTDAFKQGQNKTEAVIKYLLEKGFTPTKMMDSFAIAIGGSTFYRNKINKYLKQGMSQSEAESQAFLDFQEIAEETQQSSRPDLISMQQASSLGRLILAWANTPMQYTRLTKKALSDIVNGRGDLKANISKILYYGAIQNIIFGSLQTGLAFLMFGDDEDDKDRDKKETRVLNGMLDTLLRGTGVYGALVSAVKNTLITAHEELGKGYGKKDYSKIMQQLISLSPPISSKVRKIVGAIKTYDFNKDVMKQMDHGINNPAWNMFANVIEGITNAPVGRIQSKLSNVREAIVGDHEMWQRVALVMGWSKWDVGVKDAEVEEARKQVKENRKEEKKKTRAKKFKCSATRSNGERCSMVVDKKGGKCVHHRPFKDGSDSDGDGKKEYQCRAKTSSGKRCKNKTENKNKKCYAHQ